MQEIHGVLGYYSKKLEVRKEEREGGTEGGRGGGNFVYEVQTKGKTCFHFIKRKEQHEDLLIAYRVPGNLQKLSQLLLPIYSK